MTVDEFIMLSVDNVVSLQRYVTDAPFFCIDIVSADNAEPLARMQVSKDAPGTQIVFLSGEF